MNAKVFNECKMYKVRSFFKIGEMPTMPVRNTNNHSPSR